MAKVDFFTAVSFGDRPKSLSQSLLETVDSYFYLGGKKAYAIPGHTQQGAEGAVLTQDSPAFLITALKVISYLTVALPAIMLTAKNVLRSIHTFHIVDVKQKVEEGVDISQDTIEKIRTLLPKIQGRQDDAEITWHAGRNNLVFSLTAVPDLIFKTAPPKVGVVRASGYLNAQQRSEQRFANMVKAQEVCLAHQLALLIIPHAKKFNVDGTTLIAEQRIDIHQHDSAQEELYQELSGLDETTRQLATFIAKTGFSDAEWRNMPIVDDDPKFQGSRRVALIDLEEMEDAAIGFFGGIFERRGLVQCLSSEAQIDIALAEAQHCGVVSRWVTPAQIKASRIEEVQNYQQLRKFYTRNGILENARKPIQVDDLATLDLNLDEQGHLRIPEIRKNGSDGEDSLEYRQQPITLRAAVEDVIAQINTQINKAPVDASAKRARYILLNTNHGTLYDYLRIGLDGQYMPDLFSHERESQTWIARIINALVTKGHLFKLDKVNLHGFVIQA